MRTVAGTTTTVSGLTPGTLYRFRVRARNSVGYGPYSAWSAAGTPTGGTEPPPPPPTAVATVAIRDLKFRPTQYLYSGQATAYATIGASEALAGATTYTWEGRYLRTVVLPIGGGMPRFTSTTSSSWQTIGSPYVIASGTDFSGQSWGSIILNAPLDSNFWFSDFPSNYWEFRCRASISYILDGQVGTATGTSRTVSFREFWGGIDYETTFVNPSP